jgi:outer membrane receptor protein involved in Fe transport
LIIVKRCQVVLLGLVLFLSAGRATANAQLATKSSTNGNPPGEIRGRLVESGSNAPIGAGSVTARRIADTAFVRGALPNADGSFHIEGLAPGRYTVRVRSLGYAPLTRNDVVVAVGRPITDLGDIALSRVAAQIAGAEVRAERDEVVLAPDRNSYSTKNMTTASGGTAIDVLRNVPSVEVDGSNNVSLRGNQSVIVQINGRSSPLHGDQLANFLAQLPASTIARVEVSTNPSAKNDPEGTAGIINIVLNQEADLGVSGGVTAATGTTGLANVNGNIGRQVGKTTAFLSYGFFRDSRPMGGFTNQTNLGATSPAFVTSHIDGSNEPLWQNATFRSEYRFTDHHALSGDAMVSGGRSTRNSASYYSDLDPARDTIGLFDQFSTQYWRSIFQDYSVAFRRTGDAKATTYSTELRLTQGHSTSDGLLFGNVYQGDPSTGAYAIPKEQDVTISGNPSWSLQSDYAHPFSASTKLEAGIKGAIRHTASDFTAAYADSATGQFTPASDRAINFDYREQISSSYAVLSQKLGKVQAQAGLRLEQADTRLDLPTAMSPDSQRFDTRYASAFPSGIVSYNFSDLRSLKLSYSRRISRPNPYQLTPVTQKEDARNVFQGNPALRPEYTDALELGLQDSHSWGTLQVTPYVRRTAHAVRFIQRIDTTGVTTGTFDNVASVVTMGSDLNLTVRHGPLTLFTGGSVYHYASDATNLTSTLGNLSTQAFVWSTRANATWKLSPMMDAQFFANYRAPFTTESGSQTAFVSMNLAFRRKLWGDRGSLTVRVADPFNMMTFGSRTESAQVVQLTERSFGMRGVFISFSRNFGQELKLRPKPQDTEAQPPSQSGVP